MLYFYYIFADVAELADALVLGTSANGLQVQVLSSAPRTKSRLFVSLYKMSAFSIYYKCIDSWNLPLQKVDNVDLQNIFVDIFL